MLKEKHMKKLLVAAFGIASLAALGLSSAQTNRADWPKELTIATVPVETSRDATERFNPLIAYMQKNLGIKINFRNGADYAAVIVAMAAKQVDVAFFGPSSYLDAEDRANAEAFVKENSISSGTGYYSLVVAKAGSPIKTMRDAKDTEFAFVDPSSTSGFRVPMFSFCTDLKIEPETYFKRVYFAGTHENVILGVANGKIAIGATNDISLDSAIVKGIVKKEDFQVVYRSKKIPASPVAYRKELPESLKAQIKSAFLRFRDPTFLKASGLTGYVSTSSKDYQPFRQINAYKSSTCLK
jgi:phosphonate transport system substrate-binding protein